jgi:chromosomal replication initiation ATPase DnaA
MTDLSSHEIGQFFGGRDHSTILHSLKITTKSLQQDQATQADLRAIKRQLQHSIIC